MGRLWPMTQQVGESRERGVLVVDRSVVATDAIDNTLTG